MLGTGIQGQRGGRPKSEGGGPQTVLIPIVTRRDSSGLLKLATHSPEDSRRHRKYRSARIKRIVLKNSALRWVSYSGP